MTDSTDGSTDEVKPKDEENARENGVEAPAPGAETEEKGWTEHHQFIRF